MKNLIISTFLSGLILIGSTFCTTQSDYLPTDSGAQANEMQTDSEWEFAFGMFEGLDDESVPTEAVDDYLQEGFSEYEWAYLSQLFANAGLPFDLSMLPADTDGDAIPNSMDPDIDGDGIENEADPDMDGDGKVDTEDDDIDGDGIPNDDDVDPDADLLTADEDPDDDGDGLSDRWDLDDDGDGTPDDEDDDEDEDEPDYERSALENLIERLQQGNITNADRLRIAEEIARRLESPAEQNAIMTLLQQATMLAMQAGRMQPALDPMIHDNLGINTIDQAYKQLGQAIETARKDQVHQDDALSSARMAVAMRDFKFRVTAMNQLAMTFPTQALDGIAEQVNTLREGFPAGKANQPITVDRLIGLVNAMDDYINDEERGQAEKESVAMKQLSEGASRIGKLFADEDNDSILEGADRLRERANQEDDPDDRDARFEEMLAALEQFHEGNPGASLDDVLDDVEALDDLDHPEPDPDPDP